ncbi:MAG: hypothetical protein MUE73_03640 [Planctomycetes bacterium]|nr:hypothetical protein [Planctomycetota bacterium]
MRTASARIFLLAALPLLVACPARDVPRRVEIEQVARPAWHSQWRIAKPDDPATSGSTWP